MGSTVDFDLHGLARVRLVDADAPEAAAVQRQLGPIRAEVAGQADLTIRFVERLELGAPLRYLGLHDAAFTEDAFLVLRSKHKASVRVQIPFERIGSGCEILCERGLPAVPLLIPILNLTVLAKGALPLHAAAFTYDGTGFVATGWSKGGKTETLLAFMANGASYVGDEWLYLTRDGSRMFGIPEPIRVWSWHLDYLPQFRKLVSRKDGARIRVLRSVLGGMARFTDNGRRHRGPARTLNRLAPLLKKQLCVDIAPDRMFAGSRCAMSGVPDKFLFVASHESQDVTIRRIEPKEIAERMVFSLQEEQMNLMSYYHKYRFAFPSRSSAVVEASEDLQRRALDTILAGKEAFEVLHPYPVPLMQLFEAIRPCGGR